MKKALRDALDDRGYATLTPVQTAVMDPDLAGQDLLVSAQTGSGKTLGFGLAIAPTLLKDVEEFDAADAPLALVIAPTRELALQVKRELAWLYAKAGAVMASCVGGMDMRDERRALARGAHIVVATPGRLRDHIMRGSIDLSAVRSVVLDEADEMLDLGFREDLEFILGETPEDRQTLLFSATVPRSIAELAKSYQKDAQRIVTKSESDQHADIDYKAMQVNERDTENAVINTLLFHQAPNAIVFANTRAMVNRLTTRLSNRGFKVVALSGELSQAERSHALQALRDGRAQVCVATDVAARGIDLPGLDLVVHAELPSSHETLLHRSGRTGRAGRHGVSALIVTKRNRKKAERILKFAKITPEWGNAPSAEEVRARDEERMLGDEIWTTEIDGSEAATVATLTASFDLQQLAAAYLRLYRSVRSAPEELSEVEERKPRAKEEFGPSQWFSIAGGRATGAEPRRLLPMLCKLGGLNKDDIGAIRVRDEESFVQVLDASVAKFLEAIGPDMTVEDGAAIKQLDTPPNLGGPRPDRARRPERPGKFSRPDRPDRPERKERTDRPRRTDGDGEFKRGPRRERTWSDADEKPRAAKPKPAKPTERRSPRTADAGGRDAHKPKRKGPTPPAGKPNSKKNKARALTVGKPGTKGKRPAAGGKPKY
ncbi:DEAD/DEAH box helicase [Epibacterium sp. SM1979]|uniref:DEAD/DEAH box helicase n=1 Tax=Tritonibacter litoralis TaxID=2662264 RepID=A0A843YEG8_9RHOB|nr:DEAD/DEAH box helicase [Tritonibacter litoralis]